MKISQVIDTICQFHGHDDPFYPFDRVLWGDTDRECTGIVTTCNGTIEVMRRAHELGANLVIVHENIFYDGRDDEANVVGIALADEKKNLLNELGITVWRDHDHMHGEGPRTPLDQRTKRDYIYYGIMKVLGWDDYVISAPTKPLLYQIPETTVPELCHFLMEKIGLNGVRIVGDTNTKVRRVFICEHIQGRNDADLLRRMDELDADVFIPLEIIDWTLSSYVRDSVSMGRSRAILEMGHFNFEEPGMRWMAEDWLPKLLDNAVPVHFVPSADSFSYIVK